MVRALAALAVVAAVALIVFSGRDEGAEAQACFGIEPFEFDTLEAYDNAGLYLAAIELAAEGAAVPDFTPPSGEPHGLDYPGLLKGSQSDRIDQEPDKSLRIPPTLLKSVVWVESEFAHAHGDVPWGGVGQVSRSFDCGFGLGQITSGMENYAGSPSVKQALVGTHFLFNVAEAARMLAQKWNDEFVPIAGDGDPASLEDWYYTVWAYNGLFYTNHPQYDTAHESSWLNWLGYLQHPMRDPMRGDMWHCNDPSAPTWISTDGINPWFGRGDYTYPELVYGCMRHPPEYPERLYDDPEYAPTPRPEATPEPAPIEVPEEPAEAGEGEESQPTDVEEAEATATPTPTPTPTPDDAPEATATPDPYAWPARGADGVARLWPAVKVNMPDPTIPAVAAALSPQVYFPCSDSFWYDGCAAMHFPTSFPDLGIEPHQDPTPPVDPTLRDALIGEPKTLIKAPADVAIAVDENGVAGSTEVTVQNVGTWIAPFRVQTSDPWIVVHREGNGRLHGGVAVGVETTIVICTANYCSELITKRGHDTALIITVDPELLPEGEDVQGSVLIEPLLGEGTITRIVVHAGPSVETTEESEEAHEEDLEQTLEHRIVVPNVARDEEE